MASARSTSSKASWKLSSCVPPRRTAKSTLIPKSMYDLLTATVIRGILYGALYTFSRLYPNPSAPVSCRLICPATGCSCTLARGLCLGATRLPGDEGPCGIGRGGSGWPRGGARHASPGAPAAGGSNPGHGALRDGSGTVTEERHRFHLVTDPTTQRWLIADQTRGVLRPRVP